MSLIWYFYRRYPFVIKGLRVYYCYYCKGWGNDPYYGSECPICFGYGFVDKPRCNALFATINEWLMVYLACIVLVWNHRAAATTSVSRNQR